MEKWPGIGCGIIWEKVQKVSTAWRHGGWPPGANVVAVLLQVEVSCTEVGFCSRWVRISRWNFYDIWEGLMMESCMNYKGENYLRR